MSFLWVVVWFSVAGSVNTVDIQRKLKVELLLIHIERSQVKRLSNLIRIPPRCLAFVVLLAQILNLYIHIYHMWYLQLNLLTLKEWLQLK